MVGTIKEEVTYVPKFNYYGGFVVEKIEKDKDIIWLTVSNGNKLIVKNEKILLKLEHKYLHNITVGDTLKFNK